MGFPGGKKFWGKFGMGALGVLTVLDLPTGGLAGVAVQVGKKLAGMAFSQLMQDGEEKDLFVSWVEHARALDRTKPKSVVHE